MTFYPRHIRDFYNFPYEEMLERIVEINRNGKSQRLLFASCFSLTAKIIMIRKISLN